MKRFFVAIGLSSLMLATMLGTATVVTSSAAQACTDRYFMIPTWYKGLEVGGCSGVKPDSEEGLTKYVTIIAMNIVQALLVVAAYVTIFFLIKGGFGYMTSAGSSEGISSAKKTITNAVVGLIIAILAASIVNAIAGAIK